MIVSYMKTQIHFQDQTCLQYPVVRKFAVKAMTPLIRKERTITSIRLKLCKLPHAGLHDAYRIQAVVKRRGGTIQTHAHAPTVRSGLKSICEKAERRVIRRAKPAPLNSIGIQLNA
ncbi:MAG: hypothetical protein EA353_02705 [Puniceicoccaceae bacterium]|nr:MAG: hypothetical protein EA353_02705 [Puniceicoccaceae bacterium]